MLIRSILSIAIAAAALSACQPHTTRNNGVPGATPQNGDVGLYVINSNQLNKVASRHFTSVYNPTTNTPMFVVEYLTASDVNQTPPREEKFNPDPDINQGYTTSAYSRSGYDRGHLAPAANQTVASMASSFYLTNIAPQTPDTNRQMWRELEEAVRNNVVRQGSSEVVTGVVGDISAPKAYGALQFYQGSNITTKNGSAITIPQFFYKIESNRKSVKAYWMPNCFSPNTNTVKVKAPYCVDPQIQANFNQYEVTVPQLLNNIRTYDQTQLHESVLRHFVKSLPNV